MTRIMSRLTRAILLITVLTLGAKAVCVPPGSPAEAQESDAVDVDPPVIDFGILAPGQTATRTVTITNHSDQQLGIVKVATCPCIKVAASSMTIQPRGSIQLTATIDPKPGTGLKTERIRLAFGGLDSIAEIDVKAEVSLPVRATPSAVDAQQASSGIVEVSTLDGEPFRVLATAGKPPVFVDFDPANDQPRNRYQLRWDLAGYDRGTMPGWWVIETDRTDAPIIDLRVMHEFTKTQRVPGRPWVPGDLRILVGNLAPGETHEFITKIKWPKGNPPVTTLRSVQSQSPQFTAEFVGAEQDGEELLCTIRIAAMPGPRGLIYGQMTYETPDGFSAPLTIIGRLVE
jgi:hypothetical protein